MPGSDNRIYYVGPVRNLSLERSNHNNPDTMVVKMQGVPANTTIGDLGMCYRVGLGNINKNISYLKFGGGKASLDMKVYDVLQLVKIPSNLKEDCYFTYGDEDIQNMAIDDLVQYIGGEEDNKSGAKSKKLKNKKM